MDYDTIASTYLTPLTDPIPEPTVTSSSGRRLRDALEPIATQGWWSRQAADRVTALGLGFFDGYVWGRAASLGEPVASVVVSAFGVFEPTFLSAVYNQGRATSSRADVLAAREEGAAGSLVAVLGTDVRSEAAQLADSLLEALDQLDGCARPLFSGLRELPTPTDEYARLWRAAELVREHRGDGHLAVCVTAGLDAVEMNVLTELWVGYELGGYSSSRGFGPDARSGAAASLEARGWLTDGALNADGREARVEIENQTDRSQVSLITSLGSGLDSLIVRANRISTALLAARTFPPDPRKRAAG